jgi:hypothetical protein
MAGFIHMRSSIVIVVVGAVISLVGPVWLLQGIGVLSGSVMTGSQFWGTAGAFAVIVGLLVIAVGLIRSRGNRHP